jgi:lysophospholipase L1-like esterase
MTSFACRIALAVAACGPAFPHAPRPSPSFTFGTGGELWPDARRVGPEATYKPSGFGFDLDSKVELTRGGDSCTSDRPFFFSVALPEGNYLVTVVLGDQAMPSDVTIKAESRRLMIERLRQEPSTTSLVSFAVNIRTPRLADGGLVRLKAREKQTLHWDDKLTLEFSGNHPRLRAIRIIPSEVMTTVFLIGDSTVTDQPFEPWNSWGQMLPRFFGPGVAVANHAESGESLKSSDGARRLQKVYESIRPGDYLLVQFGHNDQKDRSPGAGAFTTYADALRRLVEETRKRGGRPVLVTSMHRKTFDSSGKVTNSLGDFPEAVRRVARETSTPLIDLNAMSQTLYEALGPSKINSAFVDGTHHNNYGSYELTRCVVEGLV